MNKTKEARIYDEKTQDFICMAGKHKIVSRRGESSKETKYELSMHEIHEIGREARVRKMRTGELSVRRENAEILWREIMHFLWREKRISYGGETRIFYGVKTRIV